MRRLLIFLAAPMLLVPACSGPAGEACEVFCECEHCNDYVEDAVCELWDLREEYGDIYGCESQFEDYANCYVDEGTCDEAEADYSTQDQSQVQCNATFDTMAPCMMDPDCGGGGTATCVNMTCVITVCNNGSNQPCQNDNDCPSGGADRCAEEQQRYNDCIVAGSADPTVFLDVN